MDAFLDRVRRFGRSRGLWQRGSRILTAVSGGPDSLALLLAMTALAPEEGFTVACCTVDHHLREEAAEETAFVEAVCASLGVPCRTEQADVPAWRAIHGGSEETAARELRYEALRRAAREGGCDRIAVAHHRDDQAETVLYHLLRGSGSTGLAGMRPLSGDLIRPFLCVSRADITEFLKNYPWEPRHDRTNDIPEAVRNRIRLLLMPELARYNPRIAETLCRTAEILAAEDDYMEAQAAAQEQYLHEEKGMVSAEATLFRTLPEAVARRLLRRIWTRCGGKAPGFEDTERLLAFLRAGVHGKWMSAAGTAVRLQWGQAFFYPGSTREGTLPPEENAQWELVQTVTDTPPETMDGDSIVLDADAVGTVQLRFPRAGDRFAPLGFSGTKQLFPYMNELRIPAGARPAWPLAADDAHIYWIGRKKVSRYGGPSDRTRHFLLLTLRRKRNGNGTSDE